MSVQPYPAETHPVDAHPVENLRHRERTNRLGLWLFILSDSFVFGALLFTRFYLLGNDRPELIQWLGLVVTVALVALVLLVPVLWAAGVYAGLVILPGVGPAATAGYLLLVILIAAGAALYFWAQFRKSG